MSTIPAVLRTHAGRHQLAGLIGGSDEANHGSPRAHFGLEGFMKVIIIRLLSLLGFPQTGHPGHKRINVN